MSVEQKDGTVDLEKELSCSICTDVLYQPLTLLDCLHTFCGSCLREWFAWQASNAKTPSPYTCPSCRAPVRDTKPNATVTTLLELFLRTHPEKAKPTEERKEIEKAYRPGDNVIPQVHVDVDSDDSENERALAQARELSLQDMDPDRQRRRTERATHQIRHRHRHHDSSRSTSRNPRPEELGRSQQPSRFVEQRRRVEHQSSLRSLLSASDIDSNEMEEEIMRQIMDEGILDGLDLNSLTPAQEEEITDRIAQAFRRRQREQTGRSEEQRHGVAPSPHPPEIAGASHQRRHVRSDSAGNDRSSARPPVSRPHLLDTSSLGDGRHRASSSSRDTRNERSGLRVDATVSHTASRSATDLNDRPRTDVRQRPRRTSHSGDSITAPEGHTVSTRTHRDRASSGEANPMPRSMQASQRPRTSSRTRIPQTPNSLLALRSQNGPSNNSSPALISSPSPRQEDVSTRQPSALPPVSTHPLPPVTSPQSTTPVKSISCSRCNRPDIQFSLHYNCAKCEVGHFNLCLACYRAGKGCLHWFGFGYMAVARFSKSQPPGGYPQGTELPHILSARRYTREQADSLRPSSNEEGRPGMEEGVFCEGCFAFADRCYWHCELCNDGAWGYCDTCVQQGKHCTHPLESMAHKSSNKHAQAMYFLGPQNNELYPAPLSSRKTSSEQVHHSPHEVPGTVLPSVANPQSYAALALSSYCDVCRGSIPPSHTRFHCPECNQGNYDICGSCYHKLVSNGNISQENGPQGWRRCQRGHRMSVIGHQDQEGGQRRVVVRDIVGGLALKEDQPSDAAAAPQSSNWVWREADGASGMAPSHLREPGAISTVAAAAQKQRMLPPDGGVGLRIKALWSYFPAEGVKDELAFPRNAEIREVEDINGDWFWGVYAGSKGLFPGNYGAVVG